MNGETIRSFLVGIGFDVDATSFAQFNKSLALATLKVTALYTGIQVATAGIFAGVSNLADGFEKLGYETRLLSPPISKMLMLRRAMFDAYSRAGIDLKKVVQESVVFNYSLAKTKFALEAIYKSVGARFFTVITKQMDVFRKSIYANMPKIQSALEKMIKFLLTAFSATVHLGNTIWSILGRVWEFFTKLDAATSGWSTAILAAVAAWKILNLSFLASPFGLILAGLVGILALFDDFKTFQEGGESFFDWSDALPVINAIQTALTTLFDTVVTVVKGVALVVGNLLTGNIPGFFTALEKVGGGVLSLFMNIGGVVSDLIDHMGGIAGIASKVASAVVSTAQTIGKGLIGFGNSSGLPAAGQPSQTGGFRAGPLAQPNAGGALGIFAGPGAGANLAMATQPSPLINQNNGTNQKVSQETNINIQGSSDANATGKAVAGEQSKVNFDMTRNLKGATR